MCVGGGGVCECVDAVAREKGGGRERKRGEGEKQVKGKEMGRERGKKRGGR